MSEEISIMPFPDDPRPAMVRKEWQCLNGVWDYGVTTKEETSPPEFHQKILVPFCPESRQSGVGHVLTPKEKLLDMAGKKSNSVMKRCLTERN